MAERNANIDKRFRIIYSNTQNLLRYVPFQVPTMVKMLLRTSDWKSWDDREFTSMSDAQNEKSMMGSMAMTANKNLIVKDIEEYYKK